MAEVLDPLGFPLQGCRLIEASAGTGKTWTIAALVLRLVAGHGCTPRAPGEILVMTFTKAATRELSDRIRARLVEAAACFRGAPPPAGDALLPGLLAAFPEGAARQQAAWRLAMAAEAMDDAAVHTIDAWCQRMLREHAFDSGCLFDEELQADETSRRAEAVRDYWRQQVYPLDDDTLAAVLAQWKDVDALARDVGPLLDKPLPAGAGQGRLAEVLARAAGERAAALAALKTGWVGRTEAMLDWLEPIWAVKKHAAADSVPKPAKGREWIGNLRSWATDPALERPKLGKGEEWFPGRAIRERLAEAGLALAVPACFDDFEALLQQLDQLPTAAPALRLHAAAQVAARLQQAKAEAGTFGFADLLARLDAALDEARHGERARRLRERILAQYPVALVDEFQDTSPVQLRIFDRLYRIADDDPRHTLLLIGDPKQAIYGFRGADIHSYLLARRATEGRHHVLDRNHRSTAALVGAVNALFERAEQRPGDGAFLFREALPFIPVRARGRAEHFTAAPALTLVADETLRPKKDSLRLYAALAAERIVGWLNDPGAGFDEDGQPRRRVQPADIAVLVRNGGEAEAVRAALRRRGVPSVYLSDKDSVFRSPEAADLLRLLHAVAAPRDVRLARAALATTLVGLPLPELLALAGDDERFDRACERLQQLQAVWKSQGVLAMLRQALHRFDLPARWLAAADERRLTNVLHLAELLQAAGVDGEQALLRWLGQQIHDAEVGDERVLRLESDADLVKVVTVHKSKGLEYPLVLLPFAAHVRDADDDTLLLPGDDGPALVLAPTPAQRAEAARERLREELRLLYVALTRARHALWVGVAGLQVGSGKVYTWHRSAIGCLVSGPDEQPPAQRLADLQALAGADTVVERLPAADELPRPPVTPLAPRGGVPALVAAPAYRAAFDRDWAITSYSALVRGAAALPPAVVVRGVRDDEPAEAGAEPLPPAVAADAPWHRFPRGALAGNFLHDQLEWLAGEGFALADEPALQAALARRCERQGWGHRADDVQAWLARVCRTPLPPLAAPLAALATQQAEMEFWFPSDGLQAERLDALCRAHVLPGRARAPLPPRALRGLLMGFADLVFEHRGRYWVLDHKSNALGAGDAAYTPAAMEAAMLEHRYDVQAALYLLALHRLLRVRLGPAYDPARQLGGALYLFLRGIAGAGAGCCTVLPPLALLAELDALLPQGAAA